MGSNENMKFSFSLKWYSLIKLMWGKLILKCVEEITVSLILFLFWKIPNVNTKRVNN